MMPFPLQLIVPTPKIGNAPFDSYIVPATPIDFESGLPYPARKIWWSYFKEYIEYDVELKPFSLKDNGPILFYISDLLSEEWNPDYKYALVLPYNSYTEAILCKVNSTKEHVLFEYDPTIRLMTFEEQFALAYELRPIVDNVAIIDVSLFALLLIILIAISLVA